MEKKQTAVEWLKEQFDRQRFIEKIDFDTAMNMEKKQIIEAAERWKGTIFAEKYYEETFKPFSLYEHKDTITSADTPVFYQTISDEELEKLAEKEYPFDELVDTDYKGMIISAERGAWIEGIKWYKEQIEKKII